MKLRGQYRAGSTCHVLKVALTGPEPFRELGARNGRESRVGTGPHPPHPSARKPEVFRVYVGVPEMSSRWRDLCISRTEPTTGIVTAYAFLSYRFAR